MVWRIITQFVIVYVSGTLYCGEHIATVYEGIYGLALLLRCIEKCGSLHVPAAEGQELLHALLIEKQEYE
jgi:hypothetical protein